MAEETKQQSKSNGHSKDSSGGKKVILNGPQSDSQSRSSEKKEASWITGAKKGLRPFYWVTGITLLWYAIAYFHLINPNTVAQGNLLISAILFVLSIPTGIILKLDVLVKDYGTSIAPELALLFALPFVLINFALIGAYKGWRNSFKTKKPDA